MPTINQLPVVSDLSGGDQLPLYNTANGDARRTSLNTLLAYFRKYFASPELSSQFVTPATGFNIAVAGSSPSVSVWVLLQPAGTLATGTFTLPLNTTSTDGQEVLVTTTQQITALTISNNGATAVYGAPTTLAAQDSFRLRYYADTNSWYRIA